MSGPSRPGPGRVVASDSQSRICVRDGAVRVAGADVVEPRQDGRRRQINPIRAGPQGASPRRDRWGTSRVGHHVPLGPRPTAQTPRGLGGQAVLGPSADLPDDLGRRAGLKARVAVVAVALEADEHGLHILRNQVDLAGGDGLALGQAQVGAGSLLAGLELGPQEAAE